MQEFIITPTNIDFLDSVFRNPVTGKWAVPIMTFNTLYTSPFFAERDPLNEDGQYQNRVIDHFYIRLTEKWLYKDASFRKLLKYFYISKTKTEGSVQLIEDPEKVSKEDIDSVDRKYIFKYIEKFFVTRNLVEKALREYVGATHIKWYDLFYNSDAIKDILSRKLKKLIISTIYQLRDRKNK